MKNSLILLLPFLLFSCTKDTVTTDKNTVATNQNAKKLAYYKTSLGKESKSYYYVGDVLSYVIDSTDKQYNYTEKYTYSNNLLVESTITYPTSSTIYTKTYTYDSNNNLIDEKIRAVENKYTYANNLLTKQEYWQSGILQLTTYFEYDATKQLIHKYSDFFDYRYEYANNKLAKVTTKQNNTTTTSIYDYYNDGSLLSITDYGSTGIQNIKQYTYNNGLLTAIQYSNGNYELFRYQ